MTEGSGRTPDQVDLEILDSVAELFGFLVGEGERLAQGLGVPPFFLKALHLLDRPMPMKDLGRRMHCDPSFVTGIADMLEKRGLAAREPDPADRRVKRLVLTEAGKDLKRQVEAEMLAALPWRRALDTAERACLFRHIAAMVNVLKKETAAGPVAPAPAAAKEEVSAGLTLVPPGT